MQYLVHEPVPVAPPLLLHGGHVQAGEGLPRQQGERLAGTLDGRRDQTDANTSSKLLPIVERLPAVAQSETGFLMNLRRHDYIRDIASLRIKLSLKTVQRDNRFYP